MTENLEHSKYNIFSKVHESEEYFLVNALSNNADLLTKEEASTFANSDVQENKEFKEKGYMVDPKEECKVFKRKYLDFVDARDSDEIQIFYVPNYFCNFGCTYCYQSGYFQRKTSFNPVVVDQFFDYIRLHFTGRKYYITLFGGEPLSGDTDNSEFLKYFIGKCNEQHSELAVVTNGYYLKDYVALLSDALVREIQVTLDGTEVIHNKRRPLKNGKGTFREIVEGIDLALKHPLPINLRMVIDRENIKELLELSRFVKKKNWTSSTNFKTQLGRNYELHVCQPEQGRLYTRIELYRELYDLIIQYPEILEFHKPSFSVSKHLFEQGELPASLYDSCPACKTEWAFDYTGTIYPCTASVGKPGEELGTFFPEVKLYKDRIQDWQNRDILNIPECMDCNLALACGGGCGMVSKKKKGTLHAPDCRPVKELLKLGISLYKELGI